jgi:hypothetical protein
VSAALRCPVSDLARPRRSDYSCPALRAGIETKLRWNAHRGNLLSALDRLAHPELVCDSLGRSLHRTPVLEDILAADPDEPDLLRVMLEVASLTAAADHTTLPGGGFTRKLNTRRASYRFSASLFRGPFASAPVLVLVSLERTTPVPQSAP